MNELIFEFPAQVGLITLNRPQALNALSLDMTLALYAQLQTWAQDPTVQAVAIRGMSKTGAFGAFCAGGDIRAIYHHLVAGQVSEAGNFFTAEYRLNHLIHTYPKPYIAFMDGVVMGGGMGLAQGGAWRVVTERTQMAMPETRIGFFPDVGGGYFLSRCPGHVGEYLGLTGHVMGADEALAYGLADVYLSSQALPQLWQDLSTQPYAQTVFSSSGGLVRGESLGVAHTAPNQRPQHANLHPNPGIEEATTKINHYFSAHNVPALFQTLEASNDPWAQATAKTLRQRSPLMLHITWEQIRRARQMSLADNLRMERDLVTHCLGPLGNMQEGIRALLIDKDLTPCWYPTQVENVQPKDVAAFFTSSWLPSQHPLQELI